MKLDLEKQCRTSSMICNPKLKNTTSHPVLMADEKEITEEDAKAEGVNPCQVCKDNPHRCAFLNLWDKMYKSRGLGVDDDNPWVFAVTFRPQEVF